MKKLLTVFLLFSSCSALSGQDNAVFAAQSDVVISSDKAMHPVHLTQLEPKFPARLARLGREGFTIVNFDIDEQGKVVNPQVLENEGGVEFARASLKALENMRYAPKVVDGQASAQSDVVVKMEYKLNKEPFSDLIKYENFPRTSLNLVAKQ